MKDHLVSRWIKTQQYYYETDPKVIDQFGGSGSDESTPFWSSLIRFQKKKFWPLKFIFSKPGFWIWVKMDQISTGSRALDPESRLDIKENSFSCHDLFILFLLLFYLSPFNDPARLWKKNLDKSDAILNPANSNLFAARVLPVPGVLHGPLPHQHHDQPGHPGGLRRGHVPGG